MPSYTRKNKITDIEHPMSSSLLGRDILGINPEVPAINKTIMDLQDEDISTDYTRKIK
jgi:hypothetical protein